MLRYLAWVPLAGCAATIGADELPLRVEPDVIDVTFDLAAPAPAPIMLEVTSGGREVTADATYELDGADLGGVDRGELVLDGRIGGKASLAVSVGDQHVDVPVTVRLRSRRVASGVAIDAETWFDSATDTPVAVAMDPSDGSLVPPNLGHLEVDFGAADADDLHELAIASPYLDVRVYAPGAPGPRHVELTSDEWDAIARTSRGDGVDLAVRSAASTGPATAQVTHAHLAIADRDVPGGVLFGGGLVGQPAQIWHYDVQHGATPWMAGGSGGCFSCHVAASVDGKRVALGSIVSTGGGGLIDSASRALITDATAPAWSSATFDPGGRFVTSAAGVLTLRDGDTAAAIATLPTGLASEPTIARDGRTLAYVAMDDTTSMVGPGLRVHAWDATTGTLGPMREVARIDGGAIVEPELSPDGAWIAYGQLATASFADDRGIALVATDGTSAPIALSADPRDWWARWMGGIAPTRADGADARPMAWLVMRSVRPVGAGVADGVAHLWLVGFYPDTGEVTPPLHLPGQPANVAACMAPAFVPS